MNTKASNYEIITKPDLAFVLYFDLFNSDKCSIVSTGGLFDTHQENFTQWNEKKDYICYMISTDESSNSDLVLDKDSFIKLENKLDSLDCEDLSEYIYCWSNTFFDVAGPGISIKKSDLSPGQFNKLNKTIKFLEDLVAQIFVD